MRLVIQRVSNASVSISGRRHSSIGCGLMVLVGVMVDDVEADALRLAAKTAKLRIFNDENGVMNRDIVQSGGEVLAVSQFTLAADTRRGNRPSYIAAAKHELATRLYELYCKELEQLIGKPTRQGIFGADMQVELTNDGPVTIIIDSKDLRK